MANPYMPYGFNSYGNNQGFNIPQMQNQLAQLQQLQSQMNNANTQGINNMANGQGNYMNQPNIIQSGMFVVVENIEDMERYPAPMNGEPVLIFIKGKSIYYSKKMTNGATSCQPYSSNVINNAPVEKPKETAAENEEENTIIKMLNKLSERLEKLESKGVILNEHNVSNKQSSPVVESNQKPKASN